VKLLRRLIERFIVDRFYLLWRSFTFRYCPAKVISDLERDYSRSLFIGRFNLR